MANLSMGELISTLRKEKGMTQKDLADKMNVTDKAVSKWERNLSCPDINSIPDLAEALGISVEELLNASKKEEETKKENILSTILFAVPLAMGICVFVTALLGELTLRSGFMLLAVGMICLAAGTFCNKKNQ